ncbi:MAG: tRNA lysidine(34) synthetase TilS [Leptospirales bacterium]|nr:tRNA lysidine(34) synthetase TilS [Leptospirales bacterium]
MKVKANILNPFKEKVFAFIKENALITGGERLLLSLSAGKDSMAMLHVFLTLADELKIGAMGVFHLNHMTRGDESYADFEFVRNAASRCGMPFHGKSFDFLNTDGNGRSFEEYARDIRYSMIRDIQAEFGYDLAATAHNLDDNAETVLLRLFQGTGIFGLRGIPAKRDGIIRPLRSCSVSEIIDYLKTNGIVWREDSSNADMRYKRNFIRNRVLNAVKDEYPLYAEAIHKLGGLAHNYTELVDELAASLFGQLVFKTDLGRTIAAYKVDNNREMLSHLLAQAIRDAGGFPSVSLIDEALKKYGSYKPRLVLYESSLFVIEKMPIDGKRHIIIRQAGAVIRKPLPDWEYEVKGLGLVRLEDAGLTVSVRHCTYDFFAENFKNPKMVFVSVPAGAKINIRNRRDGDRIKTESGTKKIKDIFIEKKMDAAAKSMVPLLIVNSEVAAIMQGFTEGYGNRAAKNVRVTPQSEEILVFEKVEQDFHKIYKMD